MAEEVDLDIYQGEDWTTDIIWTDVFGDGMAVVHPCRMDIKATGGATLISLVTDPDIPDGEIPSIALSTNIGLLQLHIPAATTAAFTPGTYRYDLFVTVDTGEDYPGPQVTSLIGGSVTVNKRTTEL